MKIAVIGAGVAGLTSAYYLSRHHDVTLIESSSRIGGHANPVEVNEDGQTLTLDTGFVIFNQKSYPNFLRFLSDLGANHDILPSDMSIGFFGGDGHHYNTSGLRTLFPDLGSIFRKDSYLIAMDLLRFRKHALELLSGKGTRATLGEFLQAYSASFRNRFALPLASLVWSMPRHLILAMPAQTFIEFIAHHGHFESVTKKNWFSFRLSSAQYLEAFRRRFTGTLRTNTRITSLSELDGTHVLVTCENGTSEIFDRVVVALHADHAFSVLADPNPLQRELLGAWGYHSSTAYLHSDPRALPGKPALWGCWNTTTTSAGAFMSYYLNRIHGLKAQRPYFLTLDPLIDIDSNKIHQRFQYAHPVFNEEVLSLQPRLPELNLNGAIKFCGSYFGYGFHEDAVTSGLRAAEAICDLETPNQLVKSG